MLGSILSFTSLMLLVMSYARYTNSKNLKLVHFFNNLPFVDQTNSPHWLVSWHDTYSPFKNMGLWEFCFSKFRYPNYQFDDLFDGCHYVFSRKYFVIWEWLLPGWLMAVQAFMTLALIFSCSGHIISTMLLVRWPLNFTFRWQWQMLALCALFNALKTFSLFLSVAVFGGQCWRRDWMLYPNFNYLSWSYAFAVIAMLIGAASTAAFYFVRTFPFNNRRSKKR